MKYYIIAGEASGDLHGSNLMKELRKGDPGAVFRCWGGDLMKAAGGELVRHYRDLAFMGFAEVLLNIRTIMGNLRFCREDIMNFGPDMIILIDYPGFNLRIAEFAHKKGFRVTYYISPQVWAWKKSRVYSIRRNVDKMLVILPFEEDFYRGYDYRATFVGHPLLDVINRPSAYPGPENFRQENGLDDRPVIALLPGSRKQEIKRMLPVMSPMAKKFGDYQFVVAGAPAVEPEFYREVSGRNEIKIIFSKTHEILRHSHAALVTSGTATLETALYGVPQVVCYKGSPVSYAIAKRIVDVKYISLVNLIMDEKVVTELIQGDCNEDNLETELKAILDETERARICARYNLLREKLGGEGASGRAAGEILGLGVGHRAKD